MNKVWFPSMPAGVPGKMPWFAAKSVRPSPSLSPAKSAAKVPGAKFVCAAKPLPVPR